MGSLLWVTSQDSILTFDTHLHKHGFGPCSCQHTKGKAATKACVANTGLQSLQGAPEALVLHVSAQINLLLGLRYALLRRSCLAVGLLH